MSEPRTVLDHLLDARDALVQEADRLAVAITDLDSVIEGIGGGAGRLGLAPANLMAASAGRARHESGRAGQDAGSSRQPSRGGRRSPSRNAQSASDADRAPKSIRVHILETLAADNREFGLAEIIDGVHAAGIQAHDDAVRSITIKLMKDGRVERVGRGQYRLARRGEARSASAPVALPEPAEPEEAPAAEDVTPADDDAEFAPPLNLNEPWGAQN